MKKPFSFILISTLFLISCKNKKAAGAEETSTDYFPVLSYIKSQVAHVDTSLYRIIKLVQRDSTTRDTIYLKREQFREAAKDFLSIPDISSGDLKDEYTETKIFDQDLERAVLNYMPKEPDKEITRQEVIINPGSDGDKVQSIFINRVISTEDSTVQKILFWEIDKKFKVVTLIQKPNTPEKKTTEEVIWNNFQ
jgi:hypothetical protein